MSVGGVPAQQVSLGAEEGKAITYIRFEQDDDTIVIEGTGDAVAMVVESMQFPSGEGTVTDRPLTHWDQREGRICVQVITYAKEREEAVCEAFPTPCDVPDGWEVCDSGDVVQKF